MTGVGTSIPTPGAVTPTNLTPPTPTPPVTPNQTTAANDVGAAFASTPGGLTPEQQKAATGVEKAFTPPTTSTSTIPAATTTVPTTTTTLNGVDYAADDRAALKAANDAYQVQAKSVQATIANIANGVTPLDAGEQAQVDGLTSQFNTLIQQQLQQNTSATGAGNIRGYQTGSAEYDPSFQVKTIGSIVSAGIAKVSDLQVKEASALAQLTQGFRTGKITMIKDAWDVYQSAYNDRKDALQKTIDDTQKAIKDAQDQQQKVQDNVDAVAKEAAQFGAPQSVLTAIGTAKSQADAIAAATGYLQDPTSTGGQYNSYVRQATAAGQTPISPAAFIAKQKYSEAYSTAAGSEAGKLSVTGAAGSNATTTSGLPASQVAALKSNGFTSYNSSTQNLAQQLATGQLAPAELSKRTTGSSSYNDVLTAADKYSMATTGQHFDISKADRNYKFASNPATQNTLNYLGSLVGSDNGSGLAGGNLDQLISLSNARTQVPSNASITGKEILESGQGLPPLNDVTQWAKIQTGDPQMVAYYGTLLEVSDQVAKVLQGGGSGGGTSDAKLAQAQSLFQKGFTPDQVSAVASQLKELLASRAANIVKDNPYLSDYATQFGVQKNNGVVTTNQKIINDENVSAGKISAFYNQSSDNAKIIDQIHQQFPDISASEVAQQLGL